MFYAFLGGLSKVSEKIAIAANILGTLMVLGLVAVVNYDVVARGVFNTPFMGAVEVVQFALVLIVFLQLPDVVRVDRLTRSDGFLLVIARKYPIAGQILRRAINLLSAIFMCLVAFAIFPEFIDMWHTQDYFGVPGVFTAPWWPVKLVILLSAILCTILFALKVIMPTIKSNLVTLPESETSK